MNQFNEMDDPKIAPLIWLLVKLKLKLKSWQAVNYFRRELSGSNKIRPTRSAGFPPIKSVSTSKWPQGSKAIRLASYGGPLRG